MNRKAIVSGPLAAKPGNAGGAWERFSWAVGLRRLGFDPASASAPFVATLVDVTGLIIYFSVALVILGKYMG